MRAARSRSANTVSIFDEIISAAWNWKFSSVRNCKWQQGTGQRGDARAGAHQKVATDSGFSCPDADITDAEDILDIVDAIDIRRLACS